MSSETSALMRVVKVDYDIAKGIDVLNSEVDRNVVKVLLS